MNKETGIDFSKQQVEYNTKWKKVELALKRAAIDEASKRRENQSGVLER